MFRKHFPVFSFDIIIPQCFHLPGEMIIGPTKALFMDEISTGLDNSTTFQIVTYLQQLTHITKSTILVSLLQPASETFDLFDDIILMAEGKIALMEF